MREGKDMESRRAFLRKSLLGLGAVAVTGVGSELLAKSKSKSKKLTILHTNDMHSWIEPYTKGKYKGKGGMAQRASLIKKIREQESNVLLLDAGDIFQGTPYFNFFGGELEFKLMSKMGYDASTLGNHDFDNGLEGLKKALPHAEFPFLTSNYDFNDTILEGTFKPYKVFVKEGVRVGVFGINIEMQGLISEKNYGETKWQDPIGKAQDTVKILREKEKCDFVICLSHLGLKYDDAPDKMCDLRLAKSVDGIDLIIGGHTHTFLQKPMIEKSPNGGNVIINQVGWAGINLGRIDIKFSYQHKPEDWNSTAINIVDNAWITT